MTKLSKKIPQISGVYFFSGSGGKNGAGKIIYVGKAANLKARLSSYFLKNREPRIAKMVAEAKTVSWKKTESAVDALILEAALIKKLKPKYNVLMRDDKNYFFAGLTKGEFPKIFLTHQPARRLQTTNCKLPTNFIGPFTDGGSLKSVLYSLRKIFPYCSCFEFHNRPCLRAHLKKCAGVCCLKKEKRTEFFSGNEVNELKRQYRLNIFQIKKILLGERKNILRNLKKEMKKAAGTGNYEEAAKVRDKISALENIFAHSRAVSDFVRRRQDDVKIANDLKRFFGISEFPKRVEVYDISNISGKFAVGAMAVFADGKPSPKDYRRFKIKGEQEPNDPKMMREMIERRFNHDEWPLPDLIIVDGGAGQMSAALAAVKTWKPSFQVNPALCLRGIALRGKEITETSPRQDCGVFPKSGVKVIAIAKGLEEIYRSDEKKVFLSSLNDETRLFLERARDEAHRFAIKYHRRRRLSGLKNLD